jgi:hypothetical protein
LNINKLDDMPMVIHIVKHFATVEKPMIITVLLYTIHGSLALQIEGSYGRASIKDIKGNFI